MIGAMRAEGVRHPAQGRPRVDRPIGRAHPRRDRLRRHAVIALVVASGPAAATDYTGLATLLVGLPVFVVLNLVLGVLLALPASKAGKRIASVLFVPLALLGLLLCVDATAILQRGIGWDWLISVGYFALVGLAVFLYRRLMTQTPGRPAGG